MIFKKNELIQMIKDYSQEMGLEKPNELVLEEIESQYAYDPYNNSFLFKIVEGFAVIPLAFPEEGECQLLLGELYTLDNEGMEKVANKMRTAYEELIDMARGE